MTAVESNRPRARPAGLARVRNVLATAFLPWRLVAFLLKPRVGPLSRDRVLDRLAFWRSVAGLVVVAIATFRFQDVFGNTVEKSLHTGGFAAQLFPVSFLVMLAVTRSGRRREIVSGGLRLLKRAALALACVVVPFAVLFGAIDLMADGPSPDGIVHLHVSGPGAVSPWLVPLMILGTSWLLCCWACTVYWAARTGFWTGEIHPLLAPIGTTFVMLVITGREIIGGETNNVPVTLWLGLNLCGTVSSLVLAFFEFRHLGKAGYRFRDGPTPIPVTRETSCVDTQELIRPVWTDQRPPSMQRDRASADRDGLDRFAARPDQAHREPPV